VCFILQGFFRAVGRPVALVYFKSLVFAAQCYWYYIASFAVTRLPYLQIASVVFVDDKKYAIRIVFDCSAFPRLSRFV
jgi:hypothetical protein